MGHMQSRHLSVRIDAETRQALEAMADQRQLDLSNMTRNVIAAALQVRQRACKKTHRTAERCGHCGILIAQTGSALERL